MSGTALPILGLLPPVNLRRLILFVYLVSFAGLGVAAWMYFAEARAEYNHLSQIEAQNRRRLDAAELELKREEVVLQRLRTDPAYVEQQIRRRLGYARPDDTIFRFEE